MLISARAGLRRIIWPIHGHTSQSGVVVVGARRCLTTVGRRFFQIRSLENYPLDVDREVQRAHVLGSARLDRTRRLVACEYQQYRQIAVISGGQSLDSASRPTCSPSTTSIQNMPSLAPVLAEADM